MSLNKQRVTKLFICVSILGLLSIANGSSFLASEMRDPTKPWNYQASRVVNTDKKLKLTGIRIETGKRFAYINGKQLQVGDRIAGYALVKIEQSYVLMANQTSQRRLNLVSSLVRKTQ
jgi:hypothetical protein